MKPYQPLWSDGRQVQDGIRECGTRYAAIARVLDAAIPGRPHILDFGAYGCYFGTRLAEDFSASVVAVDPEPFLVESYREPRRGTIALINRRLAASEIPDLGEFDAALCLSVLHHLPDWRDYLDALLASATILFVETPHPDETLPEAKAHSHTRDIIAAMEALNAVPIAETPGWDRDFVRTTWRITCPTRSA